MEKNIIGLIALLVITVVSTTSLVLYSINSISNTVIDEEIKNDEITNGNDEYKEIIFTNYTIKSGETIDIEYNRSYVIEIEDAKVYMNEIETTIETTGNEIYALDINEDGTKEIISRTISDFISPPTNSYHIYKYVEEGEFEETLKISIMGSIDSFKIKGNKIKIEYEPFESRPGTTSTNEYTINF